jgi:hypothetical protein
MQYSSQLTIKGRIPVNYPSSALVCQSLRITGLVVILITLLNVGVVVIPPNWQDLQWKLNVGNQLIDRGIFPLLGLSLLAISLWVEQAAGGQSQNAKRRPSAHLWIAIAAIVMSVLYLCLSFAQVSNTQEAHKQNLKKVSEDAAKARSDLELRINRDVEQFRNRVELLLKNPGVLEASIKSGQIRAEEATLLQQFKSEPKAMDNYIQQQSKLNLDKGQQEIDKGKQQAEQQSAHESLKASIRNGITSLFLAGGYGLMAGVGLQSPKRRHRSTETDPVANPH